MTLPFFPPDLFEADREVLLEIVHDAGTAPSQRFVVDNQRAHAPPSTA